MPEVHFFTVIGSNDYLVALPLGLKKAKPARNQRLLHLSKLTNKIPLSILPSNPSGLPVSSASLVVCGNLRLAASFHMEATKLTHLLEFPAVSLMPDANISIQLSYLWFLNL